MTDTESLVQKARAIIRGPGAPNNATMFLLDLAKAIEEQAVEFAEMKRTEGVGSRTDIPFLVRAARGMASYMAMPQHATETLCKLADVIEEQAAALREQERAADTLREAVKALPLGDKK